jgi:hypothetical protein
VKLDNDFPLQKLVYKRGWHFYLEAPDDGCPVFKLMIVSHTANSYDETKTINVRHEFMIPPADYHERVWWAWVFDRIGDVEAKHEAGEFFRVDGVRLFAPHHGNGQDPYRVWMIGTLAETQTSAGEEDPE